MAEPITLKKLADADIDADTLGEVLNTDKMITSRMGLTYASAPMATRLILEQGTIDAALKSTRAQMIADTALIEGDYALVTDDDNFSYNGYYQKRAGQWVYLKANPYSKIDDINKIIYGNSGQSLPTPSYVLNTGHYDSLGSIQAGTVGYQYSSPFLLPKGATITLGYYGLGVSPLVKKNKGAGFTVIEYYNRGYVNQKKTVAYTANEDTYIAFSSKTDISPVTISIERKEINSITDITDATQSIVAANGEPEILEVATSIGGFIWRPTTQIPNHEFSARDVTLAAGDVLTFSAYPLAGTNLWDWRASEEAGKAWPLISQTLTDGITKDFSYTATVGMVARIVAPIIPTIKVNGLTPRIVDAGIWAATSLTQFFQFFEQFKSTELVSIKKGDTVYIDKGAKGANSVVRKDANSELLIPVIGASERNFGDLRVEWTADADMQIRLSGDLDATFKIRRANSSFAKNFESLVQKIDNSKSLSNQVPDFIQLTAKEYVFATAMNFILKTQVINGTDYIKISQDLGKNWTQMPNILGDIVNYHFFSDGTIMLCSPTKIYWTDDYLTLNESAIYDHDGSVFVPKSRHFFAMQTGDKIDFIGEQEIFAWGDYHVDRTDVRIWYSVDNGRTIKCAAKFGTTVMSGMLRSVRHVHRVYYHAKTNYFYITTGDDGSESMIIRARYDVPTDVWSWNILNSGPDYKFGNIMIDDDNMAFIITDYTDASHADKKGIYRVHAKNLGDITKYRLIYKCEPSEWGQIAPVSLLIDRNGNKVLLPDYMGVGFIWVAREGLAFEKVSVSPNVLLAYCIGENYAGDIYCVAYEGGNKLRLNSGSYNLTKALRDAGMSDFMRGTRIISGLSTAIS